MSRDGPRVARIGAYTFEVLRRRRPCRIRQIGGPMDPQSELAIVRRAFAKQILAAVRGGDPRMEAAFAQVPREAFLGAGPWQMMAFSSVYHPTPSADPVYLYVDQIVGLIPERHVNNGQPSLHA